MKQLIRMVEAKTKRTTNTSTHSHRQQLPHLWWWLIIAATNTCSLCSVTQALHCNGNSKNDTQAATTSHNNADMTTVVPIATTTATTINTTNSTSTSNNTTTNAFETEIHVAATRQRKRKWGYGGELQEIENKPIGVLNANVYVQKSKSSSTSRNEMSGKYISRSDTATTSDTSTMAWLNLTDDLSRNEYLRETTPPSDHSGSGDLYSTSSSFNHSDRNFCTFHEECLANSNTLPHICTIVLYAVVCVVGLFGNTLVIWVVLRFSKMQTVTNIYILNLAIADECFLIGIPFLLYTMRICSWKFGDLVCKAYMVSTSITQFTSSIFLLIMAADRYIAVCHPIESPKYRTLRIAKLVSIVAWFTSAILMLPVILFASTVRQEDGVHFSCNIDWPEVYKKHSGTTFILYTFLLGFGTPLCFILVFYFLVIRKLRSVQQKHKSKEKKRSHRKVTRLVLTVIAVYILCWLPHWISQVSLISAFVGQRELSRFEILLFLLFGCLAYSNSAMNPILYAFLSDNFRKSFTRAFTCMNRQEVDAQLMNEHSVFTHKRMGSGSKHKNSRHLGVPKTATSLHKNHTSFLAPTTVHNTGGGGGGGGGSGYSGPAGSSSGGTSNSTATTVTDKSAHLAKQAHERLNGDVLMLMPDNTHEEHIHMIVSHSQRSHGFKTALLQVETQNQTNI